MRHLGLFEGIGGFSYAAQQVGWTTTAWVEIDEFCQKILNKNFPGVKGYGDIKQFNGLEYRNSIDIITGGFPCQPFSSAGLQQGTTDPRHLWPEMYRVIKEVQPRWIVGENVYGFVTWSGGMVFEQVQIDLENEGYEVFSYILPACSVNAPHRRNRVWVVAHKQDTSNPYSGKPGEGRGNLSQMPGFQKEKCQPKHRPPISRRNSNEGIRSTSYPQGIEKGESSAQTIPLPESILPWPIISSGSRGEHPQKTGWDTNPWERFPTQPGLCRRDDGFSTGMDRLKALGNAIVPQVAIQLFKTINDYEELIKTTK